MYLTIIVNFVFEILPGIIIDRFIDKLITPFRSIYKGHLEDYDIDETLSDSEMGDKEVWFDGVDKRLIEAHSKKVVLAKPDDKSLMTKTPLLSYRGILKKRKRELINNVQKTNKKHNDEDVNPGTSNSVKLDLTKYTIKPSTAVTDEIALDCEMVECYNHKSVLARVSVVNLFGHPILDSYVEPPAKVTDYRTRYSGIRKCDLDNAPPFETVQAQVARLMKDRIVVGHAIHNDFTALKLSHPADKTRDTSLYYGRNYFLGKTPSLKKLCHSLLGIIIQKGEHDSVQDAQATMKLYVKAREKWNDSSHKIAQLTVKHRKQKTKPAKKKVKTFFVETL